MRLSDRLERIAATAAAVTEGYVADVGTDHGFVPIRLVKSGNVKQVFAMDVRKGPLARASEHVQAYHMEGQIKVRLSDGLKELTPGEADTVIMSLGTSPNPLISSTTKGLEINRRKCIIAEEENGATSKAGVFAGGDAVTGAATVILAMGAGKAAAKGIDEYLSNK